jgi:primosomal protein N' (replication factor Y)
VVVPVRNRRVVGYCLGDSDGTSLGKAAPKRVIDVPDAEPALRPDLLAVCRWMSEYYVAPPGMVLRAALPAALGAARRTAPAIKARRVLALHGHMPSLLERDRAFARSPRQRALYELLESMGGRAAIEQLMAQTGWSTAVIQGLVKRGLAVIEQETVARDPFLNRPPPAPASPHDPTPAQRAAIAALTSAGAGEIALLHGVTGSGKTLVYIELLREVVHVRRRSAIVLVPEIALTPQTVDRFRAVFGDEVAVLHSALSDGERYDAWLALRRGDKRIAVGARSAVFAPLAELGAIIVDEEHEASYKQGESPRYHAREVAIVRARQAGAVCVLGSATPSLESWENARTGKYRLLSLPERVGGGALPRVEVVDLRVAARTAYLPGERQLRGILSEPLEKALGERIQRGEQAILLLNRRGYAAFMQCSACDWVAVCPDCSISLTYHRAPERLICHYCRHQELPGNKCPQCGELTVRQRGLGTQQVERLLAERLPAARIARMDVDTTSGKWAHADILDRVGRHEVDILLGTQMIAKGLDYPNVTLVGVIDADVGINLPDFRASERAFQLISQVAGRAGRGPKGGLVVVQTRVPEHHAVRCAVAHDYARFVVEEMQGRISPPYPPTVRLANIVLSGASEIATMELALAAGNWFTRALASLPRDSGVKPAIEIIGPAPCPIERIKQRWRWHLLLRATRSAVLTRVVRRFLTTFDIPARGELRVTFDRDPVSLL